MSSSNNPEPQSTTSSYVEQASNAIKNTISKVTGGTTSQDDKDKDTVRISFPLTIPQTRPFPNQYLTSLGSLNLPQAASTTKPSALPNKPSAPLLATTTSAKLESAKMQRWENQEVRRQAHEWGEGAGDRVTGKVGELLSGPGFGGSDEDRMKAEEERRKFKQMHEEG
ncbi:hypothetical protein PAAG_05856 [Paracoccidioides lutzii Pb01]|uniref:Uncharacterized protein n=1 Tax=Paracoccidioides lutzii (strain ATCC MYA-826 / Pb01) TaxID=502779 RepID=C1H515_PARBA|nr:hypothetical protein PAAG_05856 [Paracoccidioides lutzii Pb01]EEH34809.1 hypothetical protein PAAG_05856 [Paracoccidioides lutzii Pb01]